MSQSDDYAPGLFMIGATHHQAPIAVREKLSLGENAGPLQDELSRLAGLREFTVINTCNRIEFYGVADTAAAAAGVQEAFCRRQQFAAEEFNQYRLHLQAGDAVRHLLEVASGLDSQLIGETEIFGQVKAAYARAVERQSTGPVLNRIFQKAFQAAKHVRTNTAINSGHVSVANVAVDLALTIFGQLNDTRILLLGAGDIGEKTARAFKSRGAASLTVASRRLERAMDLAGTLDATAVPFENRDSHLADSDIVVCSTSAPGAVVLQPAVAAAMKKRAVRPLFLIDLALPRDVEANVATLPNVFVYNLDDLAAMAEKARIAREADLAKCRQLVHERATALWRQVEPRLAGTGAPPSPVDQAEGVGKPSQA